MNATIRSLACLLVWACAAIADTGPTRIVVLDNENLIEGDVSRVADEYRIRGTNVGDVTLPVKRVLAVVADRKAAYALVASRSNRGDADERLRIARWCEANELPAEAMAEARAAVRMRPGFAAAEHFVATLESAARRIASTSNPVKPAAAVEPVAETVTQVASIEYNSESFPLFASKVNTILVNACANCHAREDAKSLRLTRVTGRSGITKNLMAALAEVNPKDPAASPILIKAVTPHGTATEAPFKTRSHPAYETLETWARFARSPEGSAPPESPLPDEPRKLPASALDAAEPFAVPAVRLSAPTAEKFGEENKTRPGSLPKPAADDPFDPAIFNRSGHKK
jgi:hypothetical protein